MKPLDMFKTMGELGAQTQFSNKVELKFSTSNETVPKKHPETNYEPFPEFATLVIPKWQKEIPTLDGAAPRNTTMSGAKLKRNPSVGAVLPAPQYKPADYGAYSSAASLSKVDSLEGLRSGARAETVAPAPRYSRKDAGTLDGTLPLNLPAPQYKRIEIVTSNGTFSKKLINSDFGSDDTSLAALSSAPKLKGDGFARLDEMLPWKTVKPIADLKPRPSVGIVPRHQLVETSKPMEIKAGSGSQPRGFMDVEIMAPTPQENTEEVLRTNRTISKKLPISRLEPYMQITAPTPQVGTSSLTPMKNTRSGLDVSPGDSLTTVKSTGPAKGGAGYSFTQATRFPVIKKTDSKGWRGSEVPSVHINTSDPKIERLKSIASQRRDYLSYKKIPVVKPIAPPIQSATAPIQNGTRKEDPFSKVNPIVKPSIKSPKIILSTISKSRNITASSLPTLPDDVEPEASDPDTFSSSDEGVEEVKEAGPLDDVTLVSSKPFVKRITARRRMRQGEFSKWFVKTLSS